MSSAMFRLFRAILKNPVRLTPVKANDIKDLVDLIDGSVIENRSSPAPEILRIQDAAEIGRLYRPNIAKNPEAPQ